MGLTALLHKPCRQPRMSKALAQGGRPKTGYRTRNWREYDRGLMARGDLTVWISPDLAWHASEGTGRRGRPRVFADAAIQAVLTLKVLYQLPLRAAQAMAGSLIRLAGLEWPVPHYSTLSRRQKSLTVTIPYRVRGGPLHLVIDSTGLKVLGEGEWKKRATRGHQAAGLAQGAPRDRCRQSRGTGCGDDGPPARGRRDRAGPAGASA